MFTDFMSRKWEIEKSFFDKEVMGYDPKTKKDIPWHYYNAEQESYKEWLKQVQDPITKEFYKGKEVKVDYDNEGKEIPSTKQIIEKEPYFLRRQIIRIRTRDKKEYLYSRGHMYGYTTYGEELSKKFQEPEKWEQQAFKHHMEYIAKDNKHKNVCDGPTAGSIIHYTLPFEEKNVDQLMKNAIPDVALMVKEEGGRVKQSPDLETFKTKSFDYIMNMDYLTEKEKEAKLEEFQAMQTGSKKK
jgi:hypothetical protein